MSLVFRFGRSLAAWTAYIGVLLVSVTLLTGSGTALVAQLPAWLGLAFTLAAYPAGAAVAGEVRGAVERARWRPLIVFAAAAVGTSALAFALANGVGPALLPASPTGALPDPATLTLGELAAALRAAYPGDGAGGTATDWWPYNHLAFHYVRRTDAMVLPALFAVVGLLTAHWAGRLPFALERAALWAMGLFLTLTTYLAGENGYELVVVRMAGPAEFAADLVLLVPGAVVVALALPTLADLLEGGDGWPVGAPDLPGDGPSPAP